MSGAQVFPAGADKEQPYPQIAPLGPGGHEIAPPLWSYAGHRGHQPALGCKGDMLTDTEETA